MKEGYQPIALKVNDGRTLWQKFINQSTTFWIVGLIVTNKEWHFMGLFKTRQEADAACRTKMYFYGSVQLGVLLDESPKDWPDFTMPRS